MEETNKTSKRFYALIVGSNGGIGQSVTRLFAEEYYYVIGMDLSDKDETNLCDRYYQVDLNSIDLNRSIEELFQDLIHNNILQLHALVFCAGYQSCQSIMNSSNNEWNTIMNVNLKSVYEIIKMAIPLLKQPKKTTSSSIVVISSVHALVSSKNMSIYAISKSALNGLVRSCAIELAEYQIRVNGIAPGAIDTPMLRRGLLFRDQNINSDLKTSMTQLKQRHLQKRIGKPEEIAKLAFFLSDPETTCHFLTGQTIVADGGASICLSTEIS